MRLYGLQGLIVRSVYWFFFFFYILLISHIGTCAFYLQIPQLIHSKAKWKLYKVGSNLSADLVRKQYKKASTWVFLSATVAGGAKQITLHLTWDKGILSPQIKVNTESQAIAIVKGMINVSSCWHLNAQCPYSHTPNSYLTKISAIAISQNHKELVMGL